MEVVLPGFDTFTHSPKRGAPLPLRPLVEEERSISSSPINLLESKFYGKLKSNSLIQAEPAEVHFSGFELGKKYWNSLKLINISTEVMNIHIIPTQTNYFQTTYTKKYRLVPGLAYTVKVQFCPDEWRYFYDCIRVHCKGEENLLIPVHAYPVIADLHIPPRIDLPAVPLGQSVSHAIPLRCSCPIHFEFQVLVIEPSPAFSIHPLSGVIPANGEVDIIVTFNPVQYETTQVTFKLVVSQFNTRPFLCTVTGTSNPYVAISQVERKMGHKDAAKSSAPAPQVFARPKTVKPKKVKEVAISKPPLDVCTHGGVAKMLIRDTNKLNSKALNEAISSGNTDTAQTRQVKEALFLKKVQENEKRRQESCRRWQVDHVGEDPLSMEKRRQILEEREVAMHDYSVKRGDTQEDRQFPFGQAKLSSERVVLEAGQTPEASPHFQSYPSINWELRWRCLDLFQQAARKIVIQCRVKTRLARLRELVKSIKEEAAKQEAVTEVAQCAEVSSAKVFVFPHPTFSEKDDPLALDFSTLHVDPIGVTVTKHVPFFKLKVPQHYKIMGYKPVPTLDAYTCYIPTTLARPLRSLPVEEEEIVAGKAKDDGSEILEHLEEEPDGVKSQPRDISYKFTAPDFKPIPAHPLHIFNPAPGLHAHHSNPKYLESDPEYHLCPIPTYHQIHHEDGGASTHEYLMDEEVIEDMMTWKEDFNTMVLSCLSKRRAETQKDVSLRSVYNTEILPVQAHCLKGLPNEIQHLKGKAPTESTVHLMPEMVQAMFMNEVSIPSSAEMKKKLKKQSTEDAKN